MINEGVFVGKQRVLTVKSKIKSTISLCNNQSK
jgi:hypothetical protein